MVPCENIIHHLENNIKDFEKAIIASQQALYTGILKDNDDKEIDVVAPSFKKLPNHSKVSNKLQKIRDLYTESLLSKDSDVKIIQHESFIQVLDDNIRDQMNSLRKDVLDLINNNLEKTGIEPLDTSFLSV